MGHKQESYWLADFNYAPAGHKDPYNRDYKNKAVWKNMPVNEILVVRTKNGAVSLCKLE